MKAVLKSLLLIAVGSAAVMAQSAEVLPDSSPCPESQARTCYGYGDRFCVSAFFFWGDSEFAGKTALEIMDNVAKQAKARRPSKIEITSHYMYGSEIDNKSEAKRLAKVRASNVRAALIERGVSSKILRVKSPAERCVARDDFPKQRRVEMVFIPEKKRK